MRKFYDHWWQAGAVGVSHDFRWKWPAIKRTLPVHGSTVVDFGCGDGRYISAILKTGPYRIIGVDISPYALKTAKRRFPDARFLAHSGDDRLDIATQSVDYVVAGDVIEHIFDVRNFLSEMRRILKKDGTLFISTPYHGLIKNIVIALIGFDTVFDPTTPHIRFFTKRSLTGMLSEYGFRIREYGQYGRFRPLSQGMYVIASRANSSAPRGSARKYR